MITSREKKGYIILAIILIVAGYFIYSHFFGKNSEEARTTVQTLPGTKFLPNGATLDLGPTQQPIFQQLVPPNYPVVNRGEVGNSNPFK